MKVKVGFVGQNWGERIGKVEEIEVTSFKTNEGLSWGLVGGYEIASIPEIKEKIVHVKDFFGQEIKTIEFK